MTTATTITAGVLADALRALSPIRLSSTIQVLTGVRVTPGRLAVTNLEVSATVPVDGLDLDVLVPAHLLRTVIDGFDPKAGLEAEVDGGLLRLRAGRSEADIALFKADDYPELPAASPPDLHLTEAQVEELRHIARMVSADFTRPVLTGVLVTWDSGGLVTFQATDSYRLGHYTGRMEEAVDLAGGQVLIPADAIALATRGKGEVTLGTAGNTVTVRRGDLTAIARTIEGQAPDAHQLVPDSFDGYARFDTEGIEQVERLTAGGGPTTPLRLRFQPEVAEVEAEIRADDLRRATTIPLAEPYRGPGELLIGANPAFFAQMLAYGEGRMGTISHLRPMIFGGKLGEEGRTALLMPIRLDRPA